MRQLRLSGAQDRRGNASRARTSSSPPKRRLKDAQDSEREEKTVQSSACPRARVDAKKKAGEAEPRQPLLAIGKMRLLAAAADSDCCHERRNSRASPWRWQSPMLTALMLSYLLLSLLAAPVVSMPSDQVPAKKQHKSFVSAVRAAGQFDDGRLTMRQQLLSRAQAITAMPPPALALLASANDVGQQHPDAPKLIPLSALERYQEGADLRLFCSASAPPSAGRLHFEWRKNQNEPLLAANGHHQALTAEQQSSLGPNKALGRRVQISMVDESASVLRIQHLEADDSGNYTCLARNQHGFDSSSVRVNVNVRLKWLREPPSELQVRAGKSVQLDCDASGQPAPIISWTSLKDHQTINSKVLRIDRAQVNDSGLYECQAGYQKQMLGLQESMGPLLSSGEHLRKVVKLIVNAPASFDQKFVVIQVKLGDSIQLECNATGDQPLTIDWFQEGQNKTIAKHGNDLYDIHEVVTDFGLASFMQLRAVKSEDALLYKCLAKNEFGSGERLIKLIVLGVPDRPSQLRTRDIWSRSALVTWQSLYSAQSNSRVSNYTVQYWRKNSPASASSSGQQPNQHHQNHRREEIVVDGLQSSALLVNLLPAVTYEVSVIAFNHVGHSEPSETINITTSEEEPSAPPTDVQVESRGSSTLRVNWKMPPAESLNGKLLGFYIGYRPRLANHLLASTSHELMNFQPQVQQHQHQQQQQQQQQQSVIYSFKTADAIEGQLYYDTFLTNLKQNQDYEITVRAFNKAGSGPDCHTMVGHTGWARLPQAPHLQVQTITANSVTLRWSSTKILSGTPRSALQTSVQPHQQQQHSDAFIHQLNSAFDVSRFVLYYQIQGERDWYELSVPSQSSMEDPTSGGSSARDGLGVAQLGNGLSKSPMMELVGSTNEGDLMTSRSSVHTLSNLQPGLSYRIYVAAANDYGIGDPSNVVTVNLIDPLNSTAMATVTNGATTGGGSHHQSAYSGPALLDGGSSWTPGLIETWNQRNQIYTVLGSVALIAVLTTCLIAYLTWRHKLRHKFSSSSDSSYPTSWVPIATNTIQSDYSVKRFSSSALASQGNNPAPMVATKSNNMLPLEAAHHSGNPGDQTVNRFVSNNQFCGDFSATNNRAALMHRQANGVHESGSATTNCGPPLLSSHYQQPADLMSMNSSFGTLQHPQASANTSRPKSSATLNRNQGRQLPPIPYSTLSVKEMGGSNQIKQQQQWNHQHQLDYRLCPVNHQATSNTNARVSQKSYLSKQHLATGDSQTPLIYGVIE